METVVILIREAMTKDVKTIKEDAPVTEAAKVMERNNIGSVIVVRENSPVGIVTERDITYRVVAPDKKPGNVNVKEIMSQPLTTIKPGETITNASKTMAAQNLRRLPVMEKDKLIGIITNTDIMQIAPGQIEILRELTRMRNRVTERELPDKGTCENCGDHGVALFVVNSSFVCESCRDDVVGGESIKEGL
jgi:CBS domain-containing protein